MGICATTKKAGNVNIYHSPTLGDNMHWLTEKPTYLGNQTPIEYNLEEQAPQYNVKLNGIVFSVLNPTNKIDYSLQNIVNSELQIE